MNPFKSVVLLGCLTVVALFITSCGLLGGGAEDVASTAILGSNAPEPFSGTANTTCSQACADQGQCGAATSVANSPQVVLLNTGAPNLDNHNMLLGINTAVSILQVQELTVAQAGNPAAQQPLRFYLVAIDGREPGWVAGWCVQQ